MHKVDPANSEAGQPRNEDGQVRQIKCDTSNSYWHSASVLGTDREPRGLRGKMENINPASAVGRGQGSLQPTVAMWARRPRVTKSANF